MATKQRSQMFKRLPKGENGGVQLLLIHNVEDLGKQGDIIEVKPGFALNYLLPQGLATVATDHHKRMVEKHREKLRAIELEKLSSYRKQANELAAQSITIEANANDEGHLYGSVGASRDCRCSQGSRFHVGDRSNSSRRSFERARSLHR